MTLATIHLSPTETRILSQVWEGQGYKSVATALHISHRTVGVHMWNIRRKFGVKTNTALFRAALRHGHLSQQSTHTA